MSNNIQIIGNITNTNTISRYSQNDLNLIGPQDIQIHFDPNNDYIEYYIYDAGGNILDINYDYKNYKLPKDSALTPASTPIPNTKNNINDNNLGLLNSDTPNTGSSYTYIEIDPVNDLQQLGYNTGEFKIQYNFFKNKIGSPISEYFIKRISGDRTEISITSTILSNQEIEQEANRLIDELNNTPYFFNYLINFGFNQQIIAVNIALDKIESGYEILFKLYEPLPNNILEKNTLWVVEEKVNPYTFDVNLDTLISPNNPLMLRGANFNIPISNNINTITTPYNNYEDIINNIQNSSYNKLSNVLNSSGININVDYSKYDNFIFFSSIKQRLINFYNKLKEIEGYNNFILINEYSSSFNPTLQLEVNKYKNNINNIVSNFDGYESYLYFESSSFTWPKTTSDLPYILEHTTSSISIEWLENNILSASIFDENNQNNLQNGIPLYLINDEYNSQYLLFLNMIGHYFDNIWVLLKSITDLNVNANNSNKGISGDLTYHVLKSFGIDLFNNSEGEEISKYFIGNNSGSYFLSSSLDDFSVSSSYLNNIPKNELTKEIYKRIYHNLPLLVKQKGTVTGLQNIITTFGITGSILNVKEYGGSSKSEYLKGFNNNKVRLVDNNVIENVLSPLTSIQNISSSIDNDLQYLDISFSPQTQIDLYISNSISYNNPSFSIDDYIGDPRQKYLNNYPDLDIQRKLYFEEGNNLFSGFTSSYLDYNGFIRLIQFFDNSLFKTLETFTPIRSSLSTGITFNSPALERNKVSYSIPKTKIIETLEGETKTIQISSEYGLTYDNLSGDKSAYYTGEITGSNVNIYNDYFIPNNENPYLGDINVWNSQHNQNEQISLDKFNKSEFNVLINNVSSSKLSKSRYNLENTMGNKSIPIFYNDFTYFNSLLIIGDGDGFSINLPKPGKYNVYLEFNGGDDLEIYANSPIGGTLLYSYSTPGIIEFSYEWNVNNPILTLINLGNIPASLNISNILVKPELQSILTPAELQDSYLSLSSYGNSRYNGVKIISSKYNEYSSGDKGSFGKTSAIDKFSTYALIFDEIRGTYPELVGKSSAWIRCLVSENGDVLYPDENDKFNLYESVLQQNFGKNSLHYLQLTNIPLNTSSDMEKINGLVSVYLPSLLWPTPIISNEINNSFSFNSNIPTFNTSSILYSFRTTTEWLSSGTPIDYSLVSFGSTLYTTGEFNTVLLDNTKIDAVQNNIGTGYMQPIPFKVNGSINIKKGDEIRFNQNESNVFYIKDIFISNVSGTDRFTFVLDRPIGNSLDSQINSLNNQPGILIRRNILDKSKICLNINKPGGFTGPGYLIPVNASEKLVKTLNNYIKDKENNLL
jgi:hypothetical protein